MDNYDECILSIIIILIMIIFKKLFRWQYKPMYQRTSVWFKTQAYLCINIEFLLREPTYYNYIIIHAWKGYYPVQPVCVYI